MSDDRVYIFTDGASRGNPGPAGWGAVIVSNDEVLELGSHFPEATNNQMELSAVIESLRLLERKDRWDHPVTIYTDSSYVSKGITSWVEMWVARGWKTATGKSVANKERWQDIHDLKKTFDLSLVRLPGHSGVAGNVRADEIATTQADKDDSDLWRGPRSDYPYEITVPVTEEMIKKARDSNGDSDVSPVSYLSLVEGKAVRHPDWGSCKRRVEGVSEAKFRKATSAAHEKKILNSWGVEPEDIETE